MLLLFATKPVYKHKVFNSITGLPVNPIYEFSIERRNQIDGSYIVTRLCKPCEIFLALSEKNVILIRKMLIFNEDRKLEHLRKDTYCKKLAKVASHCLLCHYKRKNNKHKLDLNQLSAQGA